MPKGVKKANELEAMRMPPEAANDPVKVMGLLPDKYKKALKELLKKFGTDFLKRILEEMGKDEDAQPTG